MSTRRARFVPLAARVAALTDDPMGAIRDGRVLVNGAVVCNPASRVRADAAIRVRPVVHLRGSAKLQVALRAFGIARLDGQVALDVGAAAGGFTEALLTAGARRVYAVDAGIGQLRGWLRRDVRVVAMERTNLADLDEIRVPEAVDLVTLDLSYLSLADAIPQLQRLSFSPRAALIALVKPTFELRSSTLAASADDIAESVRRVTVALRSDGWHVHPTQATVSGAGGAIEVFLYASVGSEAR